MSLEEQERENDMATLAADTTSSRSPPFHRRRKSWARRVERICCQTIQYLPLTFVYGLTTWAVWVQIQVSFINHGNLVAYSTAALGILFYGLANVSYTIAVFTRPGSPSDRRALKRAKGGNYEGLPVYEDDDEEMQLPQDNMTTVTAKSTGKQRYCKKCKTIKPDRTHHCSTCKQCVLKMDHHCPWLATCVGLHNYKAFILFLSYTCLFCYVCFAISLNWVWSNLSSHINPDEGWRLIHTIMLAVLSGIIGLVLSGFTGWHLWLASTGATTIESLEKTRYLNPLRKSLEQQSQHNRSYLGQEQSLTGRLQEIHANALPGVLREEEGEVQTPVNFHSSRSSARDSLQRSYASLEAQREYDRYDAYLDERDSEKLPNAFDLGWRRNLLHLFGEKPLLWALPVCNTTGDGWQWEVSQKWTAARDAVTRERAQRERENARWSQHNPASYSEQQQQHNDVRWTPGVGFAPVQRDHRPMPAHPLDRRKHVEQEDADSRAASSDEDRRHRDSGDGHDNRNKIRSLNKHD